MIDTNLGQYLIVFGGMVALVCFVIAFSFFKFVMKRSLLIACLGGIVLGAIGFFLSPTIFMFTLELRGISF